MSQQDVGRADIIHELFKPTRRKFPRRRVVIKGLNDLIQMDLFEMQTIASANDGYRYVLAGINCFSKKAFVEPVKNKTAAAVAIAAEKILNRAKEAFTYCQTDQGSEFRGDFSKLLKERNIKHYHTFTGLKASIVERFNRTIKNILYKRMAMNGNYRYIDFLQDAVKEYNSKKHSTIKMAPEKVMKKNEKLLLKTVYNYKRPIVKAKYSIGDMVRVSKTKFIFDRGYHPSWSSTLFRVKNVNNKYPVTYILENHDGSKDIEGTFYEYEIQKAKRPDVYLIEKIVRIENGRALIKWDGYSSSENTYVDVNSIFDVEKLRKKKRKK